MSTRTMFVGLFASCIATTALSLPAAAQSAIAHHAWQDAGVYEPGSRTAIAITGPITLSGNPKLGEAGSKSSIAFNGGGAIEMISVGAFWRRWGIGSNEQVTAEVYQLDRDPGPLISGNTLCGAADSGNTYLVFFEASSFGFNTLNMAAFRSTEPPYDASSSGLCGTFSYSLPEEDDALDYADASSERPAPANELSEPSKWQSRVTTNPLDDTKTVILSLVADAGKSVYGAPVTLLARCQSDKTEVYINWRSYLGSDSRPAEHDWKNVTIRIGQASATQEQWGVSTDSKATFAPAWAGNFLKRLLGQDQLVAQVTPYAESPITAIFDIRGLRKPLRELAETCKWSF